MVIDVAIPAGSPRHAWPRRARMSSDRGYRGSLTQALPDSRYDPRGASTHLPATSIHALAPALCFQGSAMQSSTRYEAVKRVAPELARQICMNAVWERMHTWPTSVCPSNQPIGQRTDLLGNMIVRWFTETHAYGYMSTGGP
jgi:hypothetical protein